MSYYYVIFFGALFAGESFLIPGVYLIMKGTISYGGYMFFGISATIISDSLWYLLGKSMPLSKIITLPLLREKQEIVTRFYDAYKKQGLKILLFSKFIYGTRIISQRLCGTVGIKYWKYVSVNSIAIFGWINAIFLSSYLTEKGLSIVNVSYSKEISVVLMTILLFITYRWIKKKVQTHFPQ